MNNDIKILKESVRKSRKGCLVEAGKERFDFDKEYELIKYKYINYERLTKREWEWCQRGIKSKRLPYKHCDWTWQIREKYSLYNITELEEFQKYLDWCVWRKRGGISTKKNMLERSLYAEYKKIIEEMIEFKKR